MRNRLLLFASCIYSSFIYAQNVGIGTTTPASGLELKGPGLGSQQRITDPVSGNSLVLQGGAGANLKLSGYNYGTATAQPLYLSVDGANTIINPGAGNVGIGTASPATRLTINSALYGIEHTDGIRRLSTFLNSSGCWIGTTSNHPLHFFTNDGSQQMTLTQSGQVGIGTTTPLAGYLLDVTGPVRTSGNTTHIVAQTTGGTNSWARLYMRSTSQSWFMGTSQNFNGNQLYIGDETNNQTRFSVQPAGGPIYMQGNITQDLGGYGTPKAMIFLNGDGTIIRCYNGLTGSSTGNCGFTTGRLLGAGNYYLLFPFDISSRFFAVSVENNCCNSTITTSFQRFSSTRLDIIIMLAGTLTPTDRPVMILVY
jgi:hypothetical protein